MRPNFDREFDHKLQKFHNLWQNCHKLRRKQAPGLISLASNTYEGLMVATVLKDQLETKNWENDSFQFFRTYLSRQCLVPISLATNLRVQSNATETF